MSRVIIQREDEPDRPHRRVTAAAAIALLAGAIACGGVWLARDRAAKRSAIEAEARAAEQAAADRRRSLEQTRGASAALLAAIDSNVFPKPEELAAAERAFAEARRLDPASRDAAAGERLASGVRLLLEGRPDEAEPLLKEACLGSDDFLGRYFYGQYLLAAQRPADAWGHFDRLLKNRPGWAPALCGRGLADLQTGEYHKAAASLSSVVQRYPDRGDLAAAYGVCLDETDRRSEAAEWYRKAIASGSLDPRVVERFGPLLIEQGRASEARDALAGIIERLPDVAALRVGYARALASLQDFDGAVREFDRALALEPTSLAVHVAYGQYRLERHDAEGARELLTLALGIAGDDPEVEFFLGHSHRALNDIVPARASFAKACGGGFAVACEEACYTGDLPSCGAIPSPRREALLAELAGMRRRYLDQRAVARGRSRAQPGHDSYIYSVAQSAARAASQKGGQVYTVGWSPSTGTSGSAAGQSSRSATSSRSTYR